MLCAAFLQVAGLQNMLVVHTLRILAAVRGAATSLMPCSWLQLVITMFGLRASPPSPQSTPDHIALLVGGGHMDPTTISKILYRMLWMLFRGAMPMVGRRMKKFWLGWVVLDGVAAAVEGCFGAIRFL